MDGALESTIEPVYTVIETPDESEQFEATARAMAQVGGTPGWTVIEDYVQQRIDHYARDLAGMDVTNMDLAKVGERFLVCNIVSMELQALLDKVRVTTEAVSEAKRNSGD